MRVHKRKRLWIDPKIQGPLVYRVVSYWVACVVTFELLNLTWQIGTGPEQPTYIDYFLHQDWRSFFGRLFVSALVLGPITRDILRVSNRFAGPLYRMQLLLHSVAHGGEVTPVRLREDDFLHGFADDLNVALAQLAQQSQGRLPAAAEEHETPELRLNGNLTVQEVRSAP